ncbi:MAG: Ig-like domain-containing protein [Verrucomicrobiota bacterium]
MRMPIKLALAASALFYTLSFTLEAQPRLPEGKRGSLSRESYEVKPSASVLNADIDVGSFSVDTEDRAEVRAFYKAIYFASEGVDIEWTGDYAEVGDLTAAAGDTSDAFKAATLLRINFFRAMVGIPANVTFDEDLNAQAQQGALVMSGNDQLSHFPDFNGFPNYMPNAVGDQAAQDSNLAIGTYGPDSIDGYMQDKGTGNAAVGHRRWLIHPPSVIMGTGDVPGGSAPQSIYQGVNSRFGYTPTELRRANAIHVLSNPENFGPNPQTSFPYVAYPQEGYIPHTLVYPRWSFSIDGANFSSATVTMTRDGSPIAVSLEPYELNIGDNTLVWVYDGLDATQTQSHPLPDQDTVYEVTVSGIIGAPQTSYTYQVTVIDPDAPGQNEIQTLLTGPSTPTTNIANQYNINDPEFNSGFRWRVFEKDASPEEDADGSLDQVDIVHSDGYSGVYTGADVVSTPSAFHLTHPEVQILPPGGMNQTITFAQTFIGSENSEIVFSSQLQAATENQFAKVQISFDEGVSWVDAFSQSNAQESIYSVKTVPLDDVNQRTFQVRFVYSFNGGAYFPGTAPQFGWLIDDISFNQIEVIANETIRPHQVSSSFEFTPTQDKAYCLQAQGMLFQDYPMEWGPIKEVTASSTNLEPGAGDDSGTILSNIATLLGNVLDNDDDPNNDPLTVTHVNASALNLASNVALAHGTINIAANGTFTYTLDTVKTQIFEMLVDDDPILEQVTYQISDGNGGTDTATLRITVKGAYAPPLLSFAFNSNGEGGTISWTVENGVTYTLQRGSNYTDDWVNDSRSIASDGSKRTINVTHSEIGSETIFRVVANRP